MALHLITRSCFSASALQDCLTAAGVGDVIMLLADGVYAIQSSALQGSKLPVYCLQSELKERGLEAKPFVQVIDEQAWVRLTEQHTPIVTWH